MNKWAYDKPHLFYHIDTPRISDETEKNKALEQLETSPIIKTTYHILGLMSGTSLDGIDLAYCRFEKSEGWKYELLCATTLRYPEKWRKRLRAAIGLSPTALSALNTEYTRYLARVIQKFVREKKIDSLDAISSHGHTVLHRPERGVTVQIGNLPLLAECLQQQVVCDFRVQDVVLGGQGAPLVPVGDALLFGQYDYCLNLGGFANVSYPHKGQRLAFDICPVNIVLNPLAERLGNAYDDGGRWAAGGKLLPNLLFQLNELPYYTQPAPKSLGLEWVQEQVFPLMESSSHRAEDLLHTLTEHIALQLAAVFRENATVLVTGGGAYNHYLLQRLQHHKKLQLILPDSGLIDYKEALVFGLLGVLRLRGENNCLASVTGAKKDHCSGVVFEGCARDTSL